MSEARLDKSLPYFDSKEQRIIDEIRKAGGDIFRDELRRKVLGSNTTFIRKLTGLKMKGIVEEYKKANGRMKTAYRLTAHAQRIFNLADVVRLEKWFSASQQIELFPEFESIPQRLMGDDLNIYKILGIEPQHVFLETSLATSESPPLKEEEVRETLSMCNAVLQNIVTSRVHPKFDEKVEGYILFHYRLEKPKEELQRLLPQCIIDYVKATDPLEQHKASSQIVELAIRYPDLLPKFTMAALNVARTLGLTREEQTLLEDYKSYKEGEPPQQMNRIHIAISTLDIFKRLYRTHHAELEDVKRH